MRKAASGNSDDVTDQLQQLADESAALKKLLELVETAVPLKKKMPPAKAASPSAKSGESPRTGQDKNE